MKNFQSVKELKQDYKGNGGIKSAIRDVKKSLTITDDSFMSWRGLFAFIKRLKTLTSPAIEQSSIDYFFVSEEAKIIFALTKLDGEARAEMLEISPELYSSRMMARKWRDKIIMVIHPDRCSHPLAKDAVSQLNHIYARMKKNGE